MIAWVWIIGIMILVSAALAASFRGGDGHE